VIGCEGFSLHASRVRVSVRGSELGRQGGGLATVVLGLERELREAAEKTAWSKALFERCKIEDEDRPEQMLFGQQVRLAGIELKAVRYYLEQLFRKGYQV
jgi:hypothetical protein